MRELSPEHPAGPPLDEHDLLRVAGHEGYAGPRLRHSSSWGWGWAWGGGRGKRLRAVAVSVAVAVVVIVAATAVVPAAAAPEVHGNGVEVDRVAACGGGGFWGWRGGKARQGRQSDAMLRHAASCSALALELIDQGTTGTAVYGRSS